LTEFSSFGNRESWTIPLKTLAQLLIFRPGNEVYIWQNLGMAKLLHTSTAYESCVQY